MRRSAVSRTVPRAVVLATLFTTLMAVHGAADEAPPAAATLEGRPAAAELSPLQALVDAAAPGATIEVAPGDYAGDLWLDKPLILRGRGRPRLLGSGSGSVVRVRAGGVTIEGFEIDGRGGGDLGRDTAGIHVAAEDVEVRDVSIRGALFGIYLREADGAAVFHSTILGLVDRSPGEKGSGIHVWNTRGFHLEGNEIRDVRDGFYIQSSTQGVVRGNTARDLRYGLHYMFSDDNVFEDNSFENGAAGTALMYSKRIVFRRNRFLHNRGFASVGLLLKACDDVVAEHNLIADNARGIFVEGSYRNLFRANVVAASDVAVVLYDSSGGNRFLDNHFVANLTPLVLVGRRTDTVFRGNYFSDHHQPDLDGDGWSDRPYRLSSVFDHLRGNLSAADLLTRSFAARALGMAETSFPVLDPVPVEDQEPRARPAIPAAVPTLPRAGHGRDSRGLVASFGLFLWGAVMLRRGRPR